MADFHRLVTPTYPGGLPGTYDLINDGTPDDSPADGAKVGSNNAGTYFVAVGENATSNHANRPHKALAENCDYLDNIVSGSLAVPADTTVTAPGGVVTKVQLTGDIFVGISGVYTAAQIWFDKLVKVVDPVTGDALLDSNNLPIAVGAIYDSADSGNVVGTEATGFHTDPWVYFSGAGIQSGQDYKLVYAKRGSVKAAVVDKTYLDMLSRFGVEGQPNVSGEVVRFMREASRRSGEIQALVASRIETGGQGDNVLPDQNSMTFDVDPGSAFGASAWYEFRFNASASSILRLAQGASPGEHYMSCELGAMRLWDANMDSVGSVDPHPLTSSTLSDGDSYLKVMEAIADTSNPPSVFKCINGRWTVTVGDGTYSFGDFNGDDGIQDAIDYWTTNWPSSVGAINLHIRLKHGTYTPTAAIALPSSRNIIIEGVGPDGGCEIVNNLGVGVALFGNASIAPFVSLELRNLKVTSHSGGASWDAIHLYNGYLTLNNVVFTGVTHGHTITLSYNTNASIDDTKLPLHATRCVFDALSSGTALEAISIQGSYAGDVEGFIVRDSYFHTTDGPPLQILSGSPASAASFKGILFERCKFQLTAVGGGAGNPLTNNGLCELVMGASNDNLSVSDITWKDCVVDIAGAASTSPMVMYMRTGNGTRILPVDKVVIDGMKITMPDQATTFIPFYIGGYDTIIGATPNVVEIVFKNVLIDRGNTVARGYGVPPNDIGGPTAGYTGAFTMEAQNIVFQNVEVLKSNIDSQVGDFRLRADGEGFSSAGRLIVEDLIMRSWLSGSAVSQANCQICLIVGLVEAYINRMQVSMSQVSTGQMPGQFIYMSKSTTSNVYFDACRFEDIKSTNPVTDIIWIEGGALVKSIWFNDCNFVDTEHDSGAAIHIGASNNIFGIENVFIRDCRFQQLGAGYGVFLECDDSVANNNPISAEIHNNYFYSIGYSGVHLVTADWTAAGGIYGHCVITGNFFKQCSTSDSTKRCVYSKTNYFGVFRDNVLVETNGVGPGRFVIDTGIAGLPLGLAWNQIGFEAYITTNSGNWPLGYGNTPTTRQVPSAGVVAPMLFNAGDVEQI